MLKKQKKKTPDIKSINKKKLFSLLRQHVIGEIIPPTPSTSIPYFIEPYDL